MTSGVFDKSLSLVVVEATGSSRQLVAETLRNLGFANVQAIASIREAIDLLELEKVDWIIASLSPDAPDNALNLLKLCTLEPSLKGTRISLLCDDSELFCLDAAFQLGLLSWHKKLFTPDSLKQSFSQLLKHGEECGGNPVAVAGVYLREYLLSQEAYSELLQLEAALIHLMPGSSAQLWNLGKAQIYVGRLAEAKLTFSQIKLLYPDMAEKVQEIAKQHFSGNLDGDAKAGDQRQGNLNVLGLSKVMIVDPDDSVRGTIEDLLLDLGVQDIHGFADGEAALAWLRENPDPSLIIQEWRIPKVAGPAFLQRAIAEGAANSLIVVLSSLLKKSDFPLVREMGVAALVDKPFDREVFLQQLVWTIQQEKSPSDLDVLERKIRAALKANQIEEAKILAGQVAKQKRAVAWRSLVIDAEIAYAEHQYLKAKDLCVAAIKQSPSETIMIFNLMGKILMRLGEPESALLFFERAQQLSPMNLERLCNIAEAQLELDNVSAAETTIASARNIDSKNPELAQLEVKVAVVAGDATKAKKLMRSLESLDGIVAYMNNRAVALARSGKSEESKDQYTKALDSIPEEKSEVRALLFYNLAMAHARSRELDEALMLLEQAATLNSSRMNTKILSLRAKIQDALKNGKIFTLQSAASPASTAKAAELNMDLAPIDEDQKGQGIAALLTRRGDICCYRIYQNEEGFNQKCEKMLERVPTFRARQVMQKSVGNAAESEVIAD